MKALSFVRCPLSFVVILTLFCLLSACSTKPFVPPAECEGEASVILEAIDDPRALSQGLMIVNLATLEAVEGYQADDAIAVLDQVEGMLGSQSLDYFDLTSYVMRKIEVANALAGAAIFIAGPEIDALKIPKPISDCDAALIRAHLAKQRQMLALYAAGS